MHIKPSHVALSSTIWTCIYTSSVQWYLRRPNKFIQGSAWQLFHYLTRY